MLLLAVKELPEHAKEQEEGRQALLPVDNLVVVLFISGRNQDRADEVFALRIAVNLLVDVVKKLLHFLIRPDILALIIRDDVETFTKRFFDAVFMVFDSSHCLFVPSTMPHY